jgi:hypothetical protein
MDRQIKWNWKMEWEILELFYLIAIERNEIVFFFNNSEIKYA